ncbi:MAG: head-tail adaptor protein [Xanthobacteraceae bacterium]|nr:MAG: head-tail adaptor protein [Xanthobacteraceae bacterium]
MLNPGSLKTRLALEAPAETPDGQGGVVRSHAVMTTIWAAVTPLSSRQDEAAAAAGAVVTHRIVIRSNFEVTLRHRLREGDRIYRIVAIRDQHDRRYREILAELRLD